MNPCKRTDAALYSLYVRANIMCTRQSNNRLRQRQSIFRAVVDFPGQQILAFFGAFAFGDVHGDATDTEDAAALVEGRSRCPDAPAYLAIGPGDPKFRFMRSCTFCKLAHGLGQGVSIVRM